MTRAKMGGWTVLALLVAAAAGTLAWQPMMAGETDSAAIAPTDRAADEFIALARSQTYLARSFAEAAGNITSMVAHCPGYAQGDAGFENSARRVIRSAFSVFSKAAPIEVFTTSTQHIEQLFDLQSKLAPENCDKARLGELRKKIDALTTEMNANNTALLQLLISGPKPE